jgi:hypothetical protein
MENHGTWVRIRATRGGFSQRDKQFFVRHLAAEGFIPDRYCRYSGDCSQEPSGIDWEVDENAIEKSWIVTRRRASGLMVKLFVWV